MDAGTKVEIMDQGEWVGPFIVTAQAGRTLDHLVLSGPSGLFELYNDAPYNVRPIVEPEAPAPAGECQEATPMEGVVGLSVKCRRPEGHPGEHIGDGVTWGGKRPAKEEFGPWEARRFESHSHGRNYLVVQALKSTPSITRFHRNTVGAPVYYTLAGATRKAAALNEAGQE